jgi:hypothetical protein
VVETVTDLLNELLADFNDERIIKLEQRVNKCHNCNGDEKQTYVVSSSDIKIIWINNVLFQQKGSYFKNDPHTKL